MNTFTLTDLELLQITGSLRGRAKSSRTRRQAKNARRRGLLHVENVFGRQRRHRALQPAAIERGIWIRSQLCKTNPICAFFRPKTAIMRKNKPKTNPIKPNFKLFAGDVIRRKLCSVTVYPVRDPKEKSLTG